MRGGAEDDGGLAFYMGLEQEVSEDFADRTAKKNGYNPVVMRTEINRAELGVYLDMRLPEWQAILQEPSLDVKGLSRLEFWARGGNLEQGFERILERGGVQRGEFQSFILPILVGGQTGKYQLAVIDPEIAAAIRDWKVVPGRVNFGGSGSSGGYWLPRVATGR